MLTSTRACFAGATLARDVPFSALYWSGLEPIRRAMLPSNARPSQAQIMTANFVAGTVGGGLAAAVTTPLDVVKTRLQVLHHPLLLTSPCLALRVLCMLGSRLSTSHFGSQEYSLEHFECKREGALTPMLRIGRQAERSTSCRWQRASLQQSCRP